MILAVLCFVCRNLCGRWLSPRPTAWYFRLFSPPSVSIRVRWSLPVTGKSPAGAAKPNTDPAAVFDALQEPLLQLLAAREAELRVGAAECLGLWGRQGGQTASHVVPWCLPHRTLARPVLWRGLQCISVSFYGICFVSFLKPDVDTLIQISVSRHIFVHFFHPSPFPFLQ